MESSPEGSRPEQSEQHAHDLAEAIPHIIWTAQPDGRLDYFFRIYLPAKD